MPTTMTTTAVQQEANSVAIKMPQFNGFLRLRIFEFDMNARVNEMFIMLAHECS